MFVYFYNSTNLPEILSQFLSKYFGSLYQWTPLHVAAKEGRDHTVEQLVNRGADISIKDKNGVSMTILVRVNSTSEGK